MGIAVILAAVATATFLLNDAPDRAAFHTAKTAISEDAPAISAHLVATALALRSLTPEQSAPYVAQAALHSPEIQGCHQLASTKYRITVRCFLTLHLQAPARLILAGTHTVEIERARGFTWALRKLPVLSQPHGTKTSVETYGHALTQ